MSERIALKRGQVPKPQKRSIAKRRAPAEAKVRVPVGPRRLRRLLTGAVATLAVVGAGVGLWLGGAPQQLWFETARGAADAGFEVRHVEVSGIRHVTRMAVYAAAVEGPTDSMLQVSLDDVRERLKALPWVADASVSRKLPDTLAIAVVERQPMALWQYRHRLAVIDREGRVLETRGLERFASLPLIVGPRANIEAHPLMTLLASYPEMRAHVDSATWIGARRWDIRFKSGETLALPEGYRRADSALAAFSRMDEQNGLLGRGFVRFDMRLPDHMTVRGVRDPEAKASLQAQRQVTV